MRLQVHGKHWLIGNSFNIQHFNNIEKMKINILIKNHEVMSFLCCKTNFQFPIISPL